MFTKSNIAKLAAVKNAIRQPYAFPGGYPKYIVMHDGETLSVKAAKEQFYSIAHSTLYGHRDGWAAEGADINWEDQDMLCAHTGEPIESAYGAD